VITRLRNRIAGPVLTILGLVLVLVLVLGVGRLLPQEPVVAVAIAVAVLLLGLTLADPTIIPLLAVPVLLVVVRVRLGGAELSASDLVLFLAFWPAVALGQRPYSAPLRSVLWLVTLYQAATLFAVVNNPYTANTVEWLHAALLTAGALVVGWALGRAGRGAVALTLLMAGILVIAVATVAQGLSTLGEGLEPVYTRFPFEMHKNFAGCVLGMGALIGYVHPPWMRWPRALAVAAFLLCCLALLFTQSRQAIIGLAVALAVVVLRGDDTRKRSKLIILGGIGALAFVTTLIRDQFDSGNQFNSVFQRINWLQDSMDVWLTDPIFGAGLRWWYTDRFDVRFQPPNAEIEVLTTAGILGAIAFLALMAGILVVLWRVQPLYGTLAFTVMLGRFVQSQFDLFWVTAQVSIPFLVAGLCLGQLVHDTGHDAEDAVPKELERVTTRGSVR
jgi:polysaccharide biosynthesis protein PslJ